ncbi:type IV pilin [Salinarchaeum laminariae]|uniref:type IV pilin n=1 Tax=Salinarchaeum laminariae TaxID=869888 RepID=UPI0020C16145|nr:type IV pilin N-terminal domain-containing protein [Salinarchaeum laminariae]
MMMEQIVTDDDAVSPVIGVILMVAITVILAAVIGAFVLGFGGGGPSAPTASWGSTEEVDSSSNLVVTFEANSVSEEFDSGTLKVSGPGVDAGDISTGTQIGAGTTITVTFDSTGADGATSGDEIELIWSEEGSSSTLYTHTVGEDPSSNEWTSGAASI